MLFVFFGIHLPWALFGLQEPPGEGDGEWRKPLSEPCRDAFGAYCGVILASWTSTFGFYSPLRDAGEMPRVAHRIMIMTEL